jgi:hypothetical protein
MTIKLFEYIEMIAKNELCLPDFQRQFVWDGDKIKNLAAAVLAKLPLASILVITGAAGDEYGLRKLGLKDTFSLTNADRVDLLVDGQQRITALAQIFSDKIYEFSNEDISKFSNQSSLKESYFLDLENEIFGIDKLCFDNPEQYLSADFMKAISRERYNQNSDLHPAKDLHERIQYATNRNQLPLFIFDKNYAVIKNAVKTIAINYHNANPKDPDEIDDWSESIYQYINDCIKELRVSVVEYPYADRAKAVDAYESLNIGGVKLDTFDILVARVSHRTEGSNFEVMLHENVDEKTKKYFAIGTDLSTQYKDKFKKYLTYLVKRSDKDKLTLELTSDEIYDNFNNVQEVIKETADYFHNYLGTRTYNDIQYYLMFDLVAFLIINGKFDKNLTEAWYWTSIFSNSYDNNQNAQMSEDLKIMLDDTGNAKQRICDRKRDYLFRVRYTLSYLQGVEENKPSQKDRMLIEQYYLSHGYQNLLEKNNVNGNISIDTENLESNHTIPKAVLEAGNVNDDMIESPLNRALITREENNHIKILVPRQWKYGMEFINKSIDQALGFNMSQEVFSSEEDYKEFLKRRYDNLVGKVESELSTLLGICQENENN